MRRRHSKITSLLPVEVQEAIETKLKEGKTYQEITDWINSLGHDISRASVGRYGKTFAEKLEAIREKRERFKEYLAQAKDDDALTLLQAANNTVVQKAFEEFLNRDSLEEMSSDDLSKMIARSSRNMLMQEKYQAEQRRKAEEAVEAIQNNAASRSRNLDAETLAFIKEQIYGITS